MLIERGDVIAIDEPHVIARAYNELNFGRLVHTPKWRPAATVTSTDVRDRRRLVRAEAGERVAQVAQGEPICASSCAVRFLQPVDGPVFGVTLRNEVGHTIFATTTEWAGTPTAAVRVPETRCTRGDRRFRTFRAVQLQADAVDRAGRLGCQRPGPP